MKYIRTKDNIFEVENEKPNSIIFCKPRHTKMLVEIDENVYEMKNIIIMREIGKDHWKEEILKQADTIEELCDEFVIKFNDEENHIEVYKQMRKDDLGWAFNDIHNMPQRHISPLYLNNPFEIYGAIWTDKCLLYVAKVNKKGELELL